jgi:hypothetical protein
VEGIALLPYEVRSQALEIAESPHWAPVSLAFRKETLEFLEKHVVQSLAALRSKLGLFPASDARDVNIGREAIFDLDDGMSCMSIQDEIFD